MKPKAKHRLGKIQTKYLIYSPTKHVLFVGVKEYRISGVLSGNFLKLILDMWHANDCKRVIFNWDQVKAKLGDKIDTPGRQFKDTLYKQVPGFNETVFPLPGRSGFFVFNPKSFYKETVSAADYMDED